MANLLLDPSKWSDAYSAPPAAWNASAGSYEYMVQDHVDRAILSTAGSYGLDPSTVSDGDTVAFTLNVLVPNTSSVAVWTLKINDAVVFTADLAATGSLDYASSPLVAGDVVFGEGSDPSGNGPLYSGEFTITPTSPPAPPVIPSCAELGRVTRIYVSGYERTRVHDARLVRGESRCLVVDFGGALPPARTITSVTWRCVDPSVVVMSNARAQPGARSVAVDVRANWPRDTLIKCEATTDRGEVYVQLIHLDVTDSWWFGDETAVSGPMVLIA